jgi:hypothetical protein
MEPCDDFDRSFARHRLSDRATSRIVSYYGDPEENGKRILFNAEF